MSLSENPNELLLQVSLANRQAFEKLYQVTSAKLFAISLRITQQEALSEEVLQDSFVKIWHNANRFDPQRAQAITWMGTIVRNQSIDAIRRHKKYLQEEHFEESGVEIADKAETPEATAIRYSTSKQINTCLQVLDERQKQMITLAYLEGYSHQEIADYERVPVGSVKTWIYRGIKKMRNCLEKALGKEG